MKKWRDILKVHPEADRYPLMSPSELGELAKDIERTAGPLERVSYYTDPKTKERWLVDGRNRLDAMELLGLDLFRNDGRPNPRFFAEIPQSIWAGIVTQPLDVKAFARSKNVYRRHLTPKDRNDLIAGEIKRDPTQSNNAISKTTGVSDKTVAAVRQELEARSEIPNVATRTDSKGRRQPANKPKAFKVTSEAIERTRAQNAKEQAGHDAPKSPELAEFKQFARAAMHGLDVSEKGKLAQRWIDHLRNNYVAPTLPRDVVEIIKGLEAEGRKNMATACPSSVAHLVHELKRWVFDQDVKIMVDMVVEKMGADGAAAAVVEEPTI